MKELTSGDYVRFWYYNEDGGKSWVYGQYQRLRLIDKGAGLVWYMQVWDGGNGGQYRDFDLKLIRKETFEKGVQNNAGSKR